MKWWWWWWWWWWMCCARARISSCVRACGAWVGEVAFAALHRASRALPQPPPPVGPPRPRRPVEACALSRAG